MIIKALFMKICIAQYKFALVKELPKVYTPYINNLLIHLLKTAKFQNKQGVNLPALS